MWSSPSRPILAFPSPNQSRFVDPRLFRLQLADGNALLDHLLSCRSSHHYRSSYHAHTGSSPSSPLRSSAQRHLVRLLPTSSRAVSTFHHPVTTQYDHVEASALVLDSWNGRECSNLLQPFMINSTQSFSKTDIESSVNESKE